MIQFPSASIEATNFYPGQISINPATVSMQTMSEMSRNRVGVTRSNGAATMGYDPSDDNPTDPDFGQWGWANVMMIRVLSPVASPGNAA